MDAPYEANKDAAQHTTCSTYPPLKKFQEYGQSFLEVLYSLYAYNFTTATGDQP